MEIYQISPYPKTITSVHKKKEKNLQDYRSLKHSISHAKNIDLGTEQKSIICNNFENGPTTALSAHNLPVISLPPSPSPLNTGSSWILIPCTRKYNAVTPLSFGRSHQPDFVATPVDERNQVPLSLSFFLFFIRLPRPYPSFLSFSPTFYSLGRKRILSIFMNGLR